VDFDESAALLPLSPERAVSCAPAAVPASEVDMGAWVLQNLGGHFPNEWSYAVYEQRIYYRTLRP
jgi:hypothetical protein